MIFRALCKLSNCDLSEGYSSVFLTSITLYLFIHLEFSLPAESVEVKSKILSLELLLAVLQNAGPVFKTTYRFINTAFKRYLCPSIGINGTSSLPRVFQLTLNIFFQVISNFKIYLKVSTHTRLSSVRRAV